MKNRVNFHGLPVIASGARKRSVQSGSGLNYAVKRINQRFLNFSVITVKT
jgi:hypothetical protein